MLVHLHVLNKFSAFLFVLFARYKVCKKNLLFLLMIDSSGKNVTVDLRRVHMRSHNNNNNNNNDNVYLNTIGATLKGAIFV